MKKITFFLSVLILFSAFITKAQDSKKDGKKIKKVDENYARSSLTYFLLDFKDGDYSKIIKSTFRDIDVTGKFDDNNDFFTGRIINAPFNRIVKNDTSAAEMAKSLKKGMKKKKLYMPDSLDIILHNYLLENNYANTLIYEWWQIGSDGSFPEDMENSIIAQRGLYNATDVDVNVARAKKVGMAELTNAGASLIDNSHLLFLDFSEVMTMKEYYDELDKNSDKKVERTKNGYKGKVTGYLFKLNYNEIAQGSFDKAFNEDNKFERNKFAQYYKEEQYPLEFIVKVTGEADGSQDNPNPDAKKQVKQKTKKELFVQLENTGIDKVIFKITRLYEPFRVKSPLVFKGKTIGAKIGKREGLAIDQRYFVWEYKAEADDEGNITGGAFKRRGVCRVKKVIDNTELNLGNTDTSLYYQVAGKKLDNGWIMQQREDLGFGVTLGYSLGQIGGLNGRVEYNVTRLMNNYFSFPVTSLKLWADIGFQKKEYGDSTSTWFTTPTDYKFLRYTFGLSKDLFFLRNYSITPFVGYGIESAKWDGLEDSEALKTTLLDIGIRLNANVLYNVQLVGSVNYYMPMGVTWVDRDGDERDVGGDSWSDIFPDRKGISFNIGVRYQF